MVLPGYIVEAATRETDASDLETLNDWLESGGDINDAFSDGCKGISTTPVARAPQPSQTRRLSRRRRASAQ